MKLHSVLVLCHPFCVGVVSEFPHPNAAAAPFAAVGHLVRM